MVLSKSSSHERAETGSCCGLQAVARCARPEVADGNDHCDANWRPGAVGPDGNRGKVQESNDGEISDRGNRPCHAATGGRGALVRVMACTGPHPGAVLELAAASWRCRPLSSPDLLSARGQVGLGSARSRRRLRAVPVCRLLDLSGVRELGQMA